MHKMTKLVLGVAAAGVLLAGTVTFVGATSGSGMERGAQVKAGGIDTAKLGSGAVTVDKLGAGAVGTAQLADGGVDTAKLGSGAVNTGKLMLAAVTVNAIADGAVNTAKLGSGAVDTLKLALNVIDTRKLLLHDVIDTGKILCVKESDHNIHAATPAQWAAGLCP